MTVSWWYERQISHSYKIKNMSLQHALTAIALASSTLAAAHWIKAPSSTDGVGLKVSGLIQHTLITPRLDLSVPPADTRDPEDDALTANMTYMRSKMNDPCRDPHLDLWKAVACQMMQKSENQLSRRIDDLDILRRRQEFFSNLAQKFSFGMASVREAKIASPSESDIWGNLIKEAWKVVWFWWVQIDTKMSKTRFWQIESIWLKWEWKI
jgi:hypothetical protein